MAEYFKKKIIGKLSDKPIILKKINPITTTPIVKVTLPEEVVSEEIIETPIEEIITPEEIIIPIEEVTISEEPTETSIEEPIVSEEAKPKRTRKKK